MKPLLHPTSIFFFLVTLIISINIPTSLCLNDSQYTYCNNTYSCGSINLTYPFFGGNRPDYCGQPNLEINCENQVPKFTIDSVTYRILAWNFRAQNLTVARDDYWSSICVSDYENTTSTTFDNTGLQYYDYGLENITLLYDCPGNATFMGSNCSAGTVYFALGNFTVDFCTSVIIPIFIAQTQAVRDNNVQQALDAGFGLKWTGYDECNTCIQSQGECGYQGEQFTCFCKDGAHTTSCNSERVSTSGACRTNDTASYQFSCHCLDEYDDSSECSAHIPIYTSIRSNIQRKVIIGVTSAAIAGLLICITICYFRSKSSTWQEKFWLKTHSNKDIEAFLKSHGALTLKRYKFSDVRKMTNSFKVKLGQGGFGAVYKGKVLTGDPVAVKMLNASKGNGEEFINEVASISRTSHVNVVTLLGFCLEGRKKALIYEFMPSGSLEKFIYQKGPETTPSLSWDNLYQIALGIARGLEYLHRGCNTRILHFDIKPHNILLDENFCPKISDFGLAKLCPRKESIISMSDARGTMGYVAPEVWNRHFGGVSHKSDVYSYGMMLLEMVGGRKNIIAEASNTSEIYFPHWVYNRLQQGNDLKPDGVLATEENEIAKRMTLVGLWCIQTFPNDRPAMSRVIDMLGGRMDSLEMPPKPILSSPTRSVPESSTT